MRNAIFALLLLLLTTGVSVAQQEVEGVVVKNGPLTENEEKLLRQTRERMIPLPDTIVIKNFAPNNTRGYVKIMKPHTVYLTPTRGKHPNVSTPPGPYLYGTTYSPTPSDTSFPFTLAHEMAHVLGPRLDADLGRPAFGMAAQTQETQAEIIGLVLMDLAFETTPGELGFPKKVDYPSDGIRSKPVSRLQYQYCVIIKETWRLTGLICRR